MKYLNARNTAYGEDRRSYKTGTNGVTSNQTVFNVSYDNGRVEAYLNGVRLYPGDDYTKSSSGIGTSITLASAIGANNVLEVVGYQGINSGNALVEDNFVVGTNSTGSGGSYGGSTTVFNVASSTGDTVSVWRNGVKLVPTTDYTVDASANTVTLVSASSSADEITVQVVGGAIHNNGLTVNSGNDSFFLPTTRGADHYVLTRDDSLGDGGTTWKETIIPPTITSITYPTQNGVQATALAASGAQDTTAETLLINGTNLGSSADPPTVQIQVSGSYVAFAGTVSCNTAGTVITCANVTKRASADNYNLRLTHGGNNQTVTTTVNFSADPSFVTASGSLGSVYTGSAMSTKTITASSSVSWYEGATTFPAWMTHFADGATGTSQNLTGTPTNSGTSEVQNFNIIIRDSENQSHNRDFSLTVVDLPTGGTRSELTSGYYYHTFTSDANFTIYAPITVDILLVGGGGGSGLQGSGGGGGGEVVWKTGMSLTLDNNSGVYAVDIGNGGSAGTGNGRGSTGDHTKFADGVSGIEIKAHGGGAAGINTASNRAGLTGGSSGGSSRDGAAQTSSRTSVTKYGGTDKTAQNGYGFGNEGGISAGSGWASASGGGGAYAVGGNGSSDGAHTSPNYGDAGLGGNGGDGITGAQIDSAVGGGGNDVHNLITTTAIGEDVSGTRYLAGGGGGSMAIHSTSNPHKHGGSIPDTTAGLGGKGGGGYGVRCTSSQTNASEDGTPNTGGGGGGGLYASSGASGGSGIVVIRYAI